MQENRFFWMSLCQIEEILFLAFCECFVQKMWNTSLKLCLYVILHSLWEFFNCEGKFYVITIFFATLFLHTYTYGVCVHMNVCVCICVCVCACLALCKCRGQRKTSGVDSHLLWVESLFHFNCICQASQPGAFWGCCCLWLPSCWESLKLQMYIISMPSVDVDSGDLNSGPFACTESEP